MIITLKNGSVLNVKTPEEWLAGGVGKQGPRVHRGSKRVFPWYLMQEGDAFVVKTDEERRSARASLKTYLTKTLKNNGKWRGIPCHLKGNYRMRSIKLPTGGYICTLELVPDGETLPIPQGAAKKRVAATEHQQWLADIQKAYDLADDADEYRVMKWATGKRVMVVNVDTGLPVWMNAAAKKHWGQNENKLRRF